MACPQRTVAIRSPQRPNNRERPPSPGPCAGGRRSVLQLPTILRPGEARRRTRPRPLVPCCHPSRSALRGGATPWRRPTSDNLEASHSSPLWTGRQVDGRLPGRRAGTSGGNGSRICGASTAVCCGASTARSERGHATSQRGSHPPAAPHPPRDGAAGVTVSNPAGAGCGGRLRAEAPGLSMT